MEEVHETSEWPRAEADRKGGEDMWTGRCGQKVIHQAKHGMREIERPGQGGFFSASGYCAQPQQGQR